MELATLGTTFQSTEVFPNALGLKLPLLSLISLMIINVRARVGVSM